MTQSPTPTPEEHKYYRQAYDANRGISFVPEKRAKSSIEWYESVCKELADIGKTDAIEKFTTLYLKSLSAQARIVSTMIAGPARFPVARMEKYNRWERTASENLINFLERVRRGPKPKRTELNYSIEAKEYAIGDVKIVHNVVDNRLQLFFPDKPEQEMIANLKRRGFIWSPRNKAWQRQLTPNSLRVIPFIFSDEAPAKERAVQS